MEQSRVDQGYRQLRAWQKADDLAFSLITLTRTLPNDYRWFTSQLARAAISVPANIAEGYSRSSLREYLHHLSIARGSLAETEYYLHLMNRLGLVAATENQQLASQLTEAAALLYALISVALQETGRAGWPPAVRHKGRGRSCLRREHDP